MSGSVARLQLCGCRGNARCAGPLAGCLRLTNVCYAVTCLLARGRVARRVRRPSARRPGTCEPGRSESGRSSAPTRTVSGSNWPRPRPLTHKPRVGSAGRRAQAACVVCACAPFVRGGARLRSSQALGGTQLHHGAAPCLLRNRPRAATRRPGYFGPARRCRNIQSVTSCIDVYLMLASWDRASEHVTTDCWSPTGHCHPPVAADIISKHQTKTPEYQPVWHRTGAARSGSADWPSDNTSVTAAKVRFPQCRVPARLAPVRLAAQTGRVITPA